MLEQQVCYTFQKHLDHYTRKKKIEREYRENLENEIEGVNTREVVRKEGKLKEKENF